MKITKNDKRLLNDLAVIGTNLYDIYSYISSEGLNDNTRIALETFLCSEKEIYKILNLSEKKAKMICEYIKYEKLLDVEPHILTVLNGEIDVGNYPYYRIIARCIYYTYGEVITLDATDLDNVRKESVDLETVVTYNTALKKASNTQNQYLSNELRLMAYLSLMDSEYAEEKALENSLGEISSVDNVVKCSIDEIISRRDALISIAHKRLYYANKSSQDSVYEHVTTERINEVINPLLYSLVIRAYCFKGVCKDDISFQFQLSYIESLISFCTKKVRRDLYQTLNGQIDRGSNTATKLLFRQLLNKTIKEIETEIVPSLVQVNTHK